MHAAEQLGQEQCFTNLLRTASSGGAHAIGLFGPEGVGKGLLARQLAFELLAADEQRRRRIANGVDADVVCLGTVRAADAREPSWEFPTYFRTNIAFNHRKKGESGWDSASLGVRDVHAFLRSASAKTAEKSRKIFLLFAAHRLTAAASAAMLKQVEEAPKSTLFVFSAESRRSLSPALMSRMLCMEVPLAAPDRLLQAAQAAGFPAEMTAQCGKMAGGRGGYFWQLLQDESFREGELERREAAQQALEIQEIPQAIQLAREYAELPEENMLGVLCHLEGLLANSSGADAALQQLWKTRALLEQKRGNARVALEELLLKMVVARADD